MIKQNIKETMEKKPDPKLVSNKRKTTDKKPNADLWESLAKNYAFVEGGQISNSFICLLALYERSPEQLSTTMITEYIVTNTQSKIYRISATLRDTLEHRLKPAGYVEGMDIASEQSTTGRKPVRMSLYRITDKGILLLEGWIAFLEAIEKRQQSHKDN